MNRDNVELLKFLRDNLPYCFEHYRCEGLCESISRLHRERKITTDEETVLWEIIERHKPKGTIYIEYWWSHGKLEPRLKFLDKLIKKYENDGKDN